MGLRSAQRQCFNFRRSVQSARMHEHRLRVCVGRQNLNYTIIDADTFEFVQEGQLPLMRHVLLQWIGFTKDEVCFATLSVRTVC